MTCTFGRCEVEAVAVLHYPYPDDEPLPRCHWHLLMTTGGVRHLGVYSNGTMHIGEVLLARTVDRSSGKRVLPKRRNVAAGVSCKRIEWLTTRVLS